ncbi:MAG TPA: aminopeptidase [Clostridiaceae bacterium]|nr:aminopeptidase [Clostridiaceae bacterium]
MEDKKTEGQKLQERLSYNSINIWNKISGDERKKLDDFCNGYKLFLDRAKTEREYVAEARKEAEKYGFVSFDELVKKDEKLSPGTKVYKIIRNKAMILSVIGKRPIEEGVNIIGGHIDAPRIDLKQNPLYEDSEMGLMKTHYYGGIKKYQWVAIPLALHGVVIKADGTVVNICIGEDDNDPVFTISDLLPHLAKDQMDKKMSEGITGEGLNLLFGSEPYNDEKASNKVKLNILNILNQKYGIVEEDFYTAELEIVPAFKARDIGIDRSMIGAYGQDDRVCSYPAMKAIFELKDIERTAVCLLTDKEEIGSMGNTGAESRLFEDFLAALCAIGNDKYNDIVLRKCLNNSMMLSADVNPAFDPNYESVYDKRNASYFGKGIVIEKYTGARGKAGGSDANPEFIAKVRKIFNENSIAWHVAELGKVDQGGGGTIAQYIANLGAEVLDCGVSILSMHAPYEVTSKADVYTFYNGCKVFYEKMQ